MSIKDMMASPGTAAGIAMILSKDEPDAARSAFSLAITVIAVGDPAAIFFTQKGVAWLSREPLSSPELEELRHLCQEEGVQFIACADSLAQGMMPEEALLPGVEIAGAVSFYQFARTVAVSLFI